MGKVHNGLYYTHPEVAKELAQGLKETGAKRVLIHKERMKNKELFLAEIREKVKREMLEEEANRGKWSM